jgi:hypothetical protein
MQEKVISLDALQAHLFAIIHTNKVKVLEDGDTIMLIPVKEPRDCTKGVFGMFKSDGHAVDRFMAGKQAEKDLEL